MMCVIVCDLIMDRNVKRANMTFYVKLDKSTTETLKMPRQGYENEAMGRTLCYDFESERTSFEHDERSGKPSTSITPENKLRIREHAHTDRRRTIDDIADIVGYSHGSVQVGQCVSRNHNMLSFPQLPYSPDFAPANFFLPEEEAVSERSRISHAF